jgi:hypothetical protein
MIDPRLLEILACPACDDRPPLREEGDQILCDQCTRRYPVRDGIPEVLVESATYPNGEPAPLAGVESP